ncbi:MAG: lysophospholipid acyltransferase family protein [Bdellovibrionota bacterium]
MRFFITPLFAFLDLALCTFVRSVFAIVPFLPDKISLAVLRGCLRGVLLVMPRSHKVGLRNLELVFPKKSHEECRQILSESYEALARHLLAVAEVPRLTLKSAGEMFDYSQIRPVWEKARASAPPGVGCIIVTAHFGSFELLVQAHALLDRPLTLIARPFALPRFERFWKKRRERFGNIQLSRKGGYREIMNNLNAGNDVLLVMDQNVRVHHAVFVDFFGIPAATTKAAALAAIRTGAPVFFAACAEIEPRKYKMLYAPIGTADQYAGSTEEKIVAITGAIHRQFERVIDEYPSQWMWIHRRFKTRPVGEVEDLYGGKAVTAW